MIQFEKLHEPRVHLIFGSKWSPRSRRLECGGLAWESSLYGGWVVEARISARTYVQRVLDPLRFPPPSVESFPTHDTCFVPVPLDRMLCFHRTSRNGLSHLTHAWNPLTSQAAVLEGHLRCLCPLPTGSLEEQLRAEQVKIRWWSGAGNVSSNPKIDYPCFQTKGSVLEPIPCSITSTKEGWVISTNTFVTWMV